MGWIGVFCFKDSCPILAMQTKLDKMKKNKMKKIEIGK